MIGYHYSNPLKILPHTATSQIYRQGNSLVFLDILWSCYYTSLQFLDILDFTKVFPYREKDPLENGCGSIGKAYVVFKKIKIKGRDNVETHIAEY